MTLNLRNLLWPAPEPADFLAPLPVELDITAGATVAATATHTTVIRVGTDGFGDGVYRAYRRQYTVVGTVTEISLEDVATVRYYDEPRGKWQTGEWPVGDLLFVYNADVFQ